MGGLKTVVYGPDNLIVTGDSIGWLYILHFHGIEPKIPIVTPVKIFKFKLNKSNDQ
ncbi:MAG: hypothetical protein ACFFG0_08535 [Candidatus Thorarchaeota archaeon]